jgi:hypothetical protein
MFLHEMPSHRDDRNWHHLLVLVLLQLVLH